MFESIRESRSMPCFALILGGLLAGPALGQPPVPSSGLNSAMPPAFSPFDVRSIPFQSPAFQSARVQPGQTRPFQGPPGQVRLGQPRMRQTQTDAYYLLEIDLNGLSPENIQVRPIGHSLLVRMHTDSRLSRTERFDDGRGYRTFQSVSTGSRTRRLPVPPDGDLGGLQREDGEQTLRISIPRYRGGAAR